MSKVGDKPIEITKEVTVDIKDNQLIIKGPKGSIEFILPRELKIDKKDNQLLITRKANTIKHKSLHGLYRTLIANAMVGVVTPWTKILTLVGTGYRITSENTGLIFDVGYSHSVKFSAPEGIEFQVKGNNQVTVEGINKQLVGQTAFQIRKIKQPDVYKGKGIRYFGEVIKLKPGKKAITTA